MRKTTVYLPEDLKLRVERAAREQGRSEAEIIRNALLEYTAHERARPTLPLFRGAEATNVAEQADEVLAEGFGGD